MRTEWDNKTEILATKEDIANIKDALANTKAEIIKWMFIFWLGQIAVTVHILTYITKIKIKDFLLILYVESRNQAEEFFIFEPLATFDNQLNIELSEEIAEGIFSNRAIITHSNTEFLWTLSA